MVTIFVYNGFDILSFLLKQNEMKGHLFKNMMKVGLAKVQYAEEKIVEEATKVADSRV